MCTMCTCAPMRVRVSGMCVACRALDRDRTQARVRICRRSIGRCRLERRRSTAARGRVDAKVAMDVVDVHGAAVAAGRQSRVRAIAAADLRSAGRGGPGSRTLRDRSRTAGRAGNRCEARCGSAAPRARCCCRGTRIAWRWRSIRSARRRRRHVPAGRRRRRALTRAAYEGKDVKGAVVLASGPLGQAWQQAVRARGAAGVISTEIAPLHAARRKRRTCCSGAASRTTRRCKSFGFKATPRVAARLRDELAKGPVSVHVDIETTFHRRPNRTLVAEIPGRSAAGAARRAGRARAGAGRERQRQRLRHAAGRGAGDPGRRSAAARCRAPARTHDVSLGRRDPRQRAVDQGPRRTRSRTWWRCCRST